MSEESLYIPMNFWFNKNPGLALPFVGLCYDEVKIELDSIKPNYWKIRKYIHIEFNEIKLSPSENFNDASFYSAFF